MTSNIRGQTILYNKQVLFVVIGGVLGYLMAGAGNQDATMGIVLGGILGWLAARFI